jgi:hypothetical protein
MDRDNFAFFTFAVFCEAEECLVEGNVYGAMINLKFIQLD